MDRSGEPEIELRWPDEALVEHYLAALKRGWQPSSSDPEPTAKQIDAIENDRQAFLHRQVDLDGSAPPVPLSDGTLVDRIPGYQKWIWDGEFCGGIGLRWAADGSTDLPWYVMGHIGYGVVPWKRRRGYATRALKMILPEARARGLAFVELTTEHDNIASQKVMEAAGAVLHERFTMPETHGGQPALRYRITLSP